MNRKLSLLALLIGTLSIIGELAGLDLPTIAWFFRSGPAFGWTTSLLLIAAGIYGLLALPEEIAWNPVTLKRFTRFRSIGRGWWSFVILLALIGIALLDHALVGKRALIVKHESGLYFPAFVKHRYLNKDFGLPGDEPVSYRDLQASGKAFVLMPLVPWDPTLDSDTKQTRELEVRDGLIFEPGASEPFAGRITQYYAAQPEAKHADIRVRKGKPEGEWLGYAPNGALAVTAQYEGGVKKRERFTGEMSQADFESAKSTPPHITLYPPLPPMLKARHYLGTDSRGCDVLAQIFGGWQLNLQAVLLYLLVTYGVGVLLGALMGFLGGGFDLIMQRVIEIVEELPFLYVVMIVVSIITVAEMNLLWLLGIICLFSWTGLTYPMRALAYKERERDYIAAARLQGASTWRILTRYLLPNMLATLVTHVPFSVAGIISSLTALSFIGFGLPEIYPQWGWLFDDGINHLSAPWLVIAMFTAMVTVLLLITFVGEALREAFDPKKFSTYQ